MDLTIEVEREEDGRWIAEVINLSGVLVYRQSQEDAAAKVKALALQVVADQIEQGERAPELDHVALLDY
jgi:predicted RNase H-like HicB family nuclease